MIEWDDGDGWCKGRNKTGHEGYFPQNYVQPSSRSNSPPTLQLENITNGNPPTLSTHSSNEGTGMCFVFVFSQAMSKHSLGMRQEIVWEWDWQTSVLVIVFHDGKALFPPHTRTHTHTHTHTCRHILTSPVRVHCPVWRGAILPRGCNDWTHTYQWQWSRWWMVAGTLRRKSGRIPLRRRRNCYQRIGEEVIQCIVCYGLYFSTEIKWGGERGAIPSSTYICINSPPPFMLASCIRFVCDVVRIHPLKHVANVKWGYEVCIAFFSQIWLQLY